MKINRRTAAIAGAIAVLGAGGGIAYGVAGDGEKVTGSEADKAAEAALGAVGGGEVLEVETQDGDGAGRYEVEVRRDDGSEVEVHLDGSLQQVGTARNDDSGEGPDDDAGE